MKPAKEKAGYSVRAACQHLGLGPHTLRAWESRYGAVEPSRTEKGQRFYSRSEIERLEKIVGLVNLGHSIGSVARLSDKELDKLLTSSLQQKPSTHPSHQTLRFLLEMLERELRTFEMNGISSLLDQKRTSLGARGFVLEILAPLMHWIGERTALKDLSIAHEHALSAVVRDQIYQTLRYGAAPLAPIGKLPQFILATPEDDLHEFGILMSATLLSHYGIRTHLLGANLPAEPLAVAVKAVRGKIVILGNSPVPENERQISFENYLRELHRLLPKDVSIWIGGQGKLPHLRSVMPGREHRFVASLGELDTLIERLVSKEKLAF